MKKELFHEIGVCRICLVVFVMVWLTPQYAGAYDKEIEDLCAPIREELKQSGKKTVAVTDFTDLQGNVTELGRFLGERFSVTLAKGKNFAVIDRMHIKTLLREHKLSAAGLIDPDTAKKLGRIAGIDTLIVGTLTPLGHTVEMHIKLLDTETARVIHAGTGQILMTEPIRDLLKQELRPEKPGSGGDTGKPARLPRVQQQQAAHGFLFELLECKRLGSSVRCAFKITSNESDRKLSLFGRAWSASEGSRLFDDTGNEYRATGVILGNRVGESSADNVLPAGVPTKGELQFEGISAEAHIVRLLEVRIYTSDRFSIKFQDVTFSK